MPNVKDAVKELADVLGQAGERTPVLIRPLQKKNEGFTDASQIQYVSLAGRFDIKKNPFPAAFRIYRSIMSYEYLWNQIRVQGGAYGCMAAVSRAGDVYYTSYRDPNLRESIDVYRNVPEYLRSFEADEDEMTKYVIGTFSDLDAPLSPADKGRRSLSAYMSGMTFEEVQKERDDVLAAGVDDIRSLADLVEEAIENAGICVIGNEDKLSGEKDLFTELIPLDKAGE